MLESLKIQRDAVAARIDSLRDAVTVENRSALTPEEDTALSADIEARKALDARISQLEAEEVRRSADAEARKSVGNVGPVVITSEPEVYTRQNGQSYFRDLISSEINNDRDAQDRLARHAVVSRDKAEARNKALKGTAFEARAVSTSTAGQFAPPLWLIDEYVPAFRAGRVTADLCTHEALPMGVSSINIPKVSTATTTATQTEGAGVSSTSLTATSVSGSIVTIAGQNDISQQLIDQSGIPFDAVILKDLLADYNKQLDAQVVTAIAGAGGNAVTYTNASPTVAGIYSAIGQGISQITKNRFASPTALVIHPSLYWWLASQSDSSGRPLLVPSAVAYNPVSTLDAPYAQGPAGSIQGLNVFLDANLPTNLGAGTNQTEVLVAKFDDVYLFEGDVRTRVLNEVLSGTLQVRVQLWNYASIIANRAPSAISVLGGTGFVGPTGY